MQHVKSFVFDDFHELANIFKNISYLICIMRSRSLFELFHRCNEISYEVMAANKVK